MIEYFMTLDFVILCTVGPPLLFLIFTLIRLDIQREKQRKLLELHMQVLGKILEINRLKGANTGHKLPCR